MKRSLASLFLCLCVVLGGLSPALADLITTGTIQLDGTESLSSTVRVQRNGVVSTWASPKTFPGTITDPSTDYFKTVSLTPGLLEFVRVTYEWLSGADTSIFLVSYLNSFDVNNLSTNYLGDPGSGVLAAVHGPFSFEIFVPNGNSLVLAFDTVTSGGMSGFGSVSYSVEGFPVPIPPAVFLLGSGLLGLAGWRRFRKG